MSAKTREGQGELIFMGATGFALIIYWLSAPSGLPWSAGTELALAWGGVIPPLPTMGHQFWGYFIRVFDGNFVALAATAMALAAGLLGTLVNRYLGWRCAIAAVLVWTTLPPVWNRVTIGAISAFYGFWVMFFIWLINGFVLFVTWRVRANQKPKPENAVRSRRNRIAGWAALALAAIFAIVASSFHHYNLGEAASVYARQILDEAGSRKIILSGVADDQIIWEAERQAPGSSHRLLAFRNDSAYLSQFAKSVRGLWPSDTNLWLAANISGEALIDLALKERKSELYVMTGASTTLTKWEARWEAMKPYLDSGDKFIPLMRRAFAIEANHLGNQLQQEHDLKTAWNLYWRVYSEIERGNLAALFNLSGMLRRGYVTDEATKTLIESRLKLFYRNVGEDREKLKASVARVLMSGEIMRDEQLLSDVRARYEARLKELEAQSKTDKRKQEKVIPPELKSLVELNNEMVRLQEQGDTTNAVKIARKILSNSNFRGAIPANAVMGTAMAMEGKYLESELFFKVAVENDEKVPLIVLNDYADTLRHLKKYEAAEFYARKAVALSSNQEWLYRMTLAQILRDAKKSPDEVEALVRSCLKAIPRASREKFLKEFQQ